MEQEAFVNLEERWWLLERDVEPNIEQLRTDVGDSFGWEREWYEQPTRLEDLYRHIQQGAPVLLTELDEARDSYKQLEWLTKLAEFTRPAPADDDGVPPAGSPAAEHEPMPEDQAPAAWDDNWQMLYRVTAQGDYQYAFSDDQRTVRSGTEWLSHDEAAAAKREGTAGPADAPPEEPAAQWDDNWQMLYRVTAQGEYQYAFSDDRHTIRAGTDWMSQDEVAAARAAEGGVQPDTAGQEPVAAWDDTWEMLYRVTAEGEYQYAFSDDRLTVRAGTDWMSREQAESAKAFAELPQDVAEVLDTAVGEAMSQLAPENLSALATELGIDEDELQNLVRELPDNFEDMLKTETAALAGNLGQ